jgi:hypothetical protein
MGGYRLSITIGFHPGGDVRDLVGLARLVPANERILE